MKKILISLIIFLISFPVSSERKAKDLEQIFQELMLQHERHLQTLLKETSLFNEFEREFFCDIGFTQNFQTVSFFENLKTQLDRGVLPHHSGLVRISYSSYSNINGVPTAISYEYRSDGKNIILTKGTLKDGQILKAVYNYSPSSKELETKEWRGNKLLQKQTYKYEI